MSRSFDEAFNLRRALDHGWAAFKAAPAPLIVGALLMQCSEGGGGGGGGNWGRALQQHGSDDSGSGGSAALGTRLLETGREARQRASGAFQDLYGEMSDALGGLEPAVIVAIVALVAVLGLVCVLAIFAFRCWIEPGWYRLHREVLVQGTGRFGTLFGAWDALLPLAGWKILAGLVSLGTFLLAAIPGGACLAWGLVRENTPLAVVGGVLVALIVIPALWYVSLGLWFGPRLVALEGARPVAALERSWDLSRNHRWRLFGFLLVLMLVQIAGFCLLCIGILVTRPIAETGATGAFLLHVRPRQETDAYWSRRTRPDPGEPGLAPPPPAAPMGAPG
ncbi:MAG: hypothetical protein JXB39_11695 [Deltaproteobacteria bacterium]|nr:hypothetical protein [Deltaproteobacteria bacterium]